MNITEEQYIAQNAMGFEGDTFAKKKMESIIKGCDVVIETGTYRGATTKWFADWCKEVYTVEVNDQNYSIAKKNLKETNVKMFHGSSDDILPTILKGIKQNKKLFIFLDAHWNEYNPLINELKVIQNSGFKPIIAIHDFKVPGNKSLGFDTYGKIVYEWGWIEASIEAIYGKDGYEVEYNSEATGAKRGIIYIYPKEE